MIIFNIKVSPTVQDQSRVNCHSTCVLNKSATNCAFHKRFPVQGFLLFNWKEQGAWKTHECKFSHLFLLLEWSQWLVCKTLLSKLSCHRYRVFCGLKKQIEDNEGSLEKFSRGYERLGINRTPEGLKYREWAPGAHGVFLTGDFSKQTY